MKRAYKRATAICIFFMAGILFQNSSAQVVRMYQGFDNYTGTIATVPAGWHISWNSTAPASYYTSTGNFGTTSPSYNFGITQDTIISPYFLSGDILWFWCKGQGSPFSVQNTLRVFISSDSTTWNLLQNVDSLPTAAAGVTLAFNLPCSAHYLKFVYTKVNGNLAFDDVKVTITNYSPDALYAVTLNNICTMDSACFTDMSTIAGCDTIISRIWNFGDSTPPDSSENPCHVFTQSGNYDVWLHVMASNGNTDSTYLTITIYPAPSAQFAANNVSGTMVDFSDSSSIASSSIVSWYWSFGDSTFSTLQNPSHQYFFIGTYYTCLQVTSVNGCVDLFCDSVSVIGAGIESQESLEGISVGPNPARNQLTVRSKQHAIRDIEIINVFGQKVSPGHFLISDSQRLTMVDTSALAPGIYFLKLNADGKRHCIKIIIEN